MQPPHFLCFYLRCNLHMVKCTGLKCTAGRTVHFHHPAEQPHAPSQSVSPTPEAATSQTFSIMDKHSLFFLKIFWLYGTACGILVLRPGIEPPPVAVQVWHPNHWTPREFPTLEIFLKAQGHGGCIGGHGEDSNPHLTPACPTGWMVSGDQARGLGCPQSGPVGASGMRMRRTGPRSSRRSWR